MPVEIREGLWKHNKEELQYQVLGNAFIVKSVSELNRRRVDLVGTALFVEGYEETGAVKGDKVQVYEYREYSTKLRFLRMGQFDAPDTVVIYRQLTDGKQYKAGQLWWRSAENFAKNFTPLNL